MLTLRLCHIEVIRVYQRKSINTDIENVLELLFSMYNTVFQQRGNRTLSRSFPRSYTYFLHLRHTHNPLYSFQCVNVVVIFSRALVQFKYVSQHFIGFEPFNTNYHSMLHCFIAQNDKCPKCLPFYHCLTTLLRGLNSFSDNCKRAHTLMFFPQEQNCKID